MDCEGSFSSRRSFMSPSLLQDSAIDVIDWDTLSRYLLNRVSAAAVGVVGSVALLLLTMVGPRWLPDLRPPAARCTACLGVMLLLQGSEAIPSQASAFVPVFLLRLVQLPCRFSTPTMQIVLTELAATFLVLAAEQTTVFDQLALKLLQVTGTRIRNLIFVSSATSALCTLLMDANASVLVVSALLAAIVRAIQDDIIQGYHQRALFDRATSRLPTLRRRQLENMLWPQRPSHDDDLPSEIMGAVSLCESPLLSVDDSENASFGESTEQALWDFVMYSCEFAPRRPRTPKHTPPVQPAYPVRSSLYDPQRGPRQPKRASFYEDGTVIYPGRDSPLPKRGYTNADESILRVPVTSLFAQGTVRDVMFWETRRYSEIYRDLLLCSLNTSVVVSISALYTNNANRYFVEYFRSRYGSAPISSPVWWGMVSPMVAVACIIYWQHLSSVTLHDFDAPQEKDMLRMIKVALQKQRSTQQSFNQWHVMSIAVFVCWAGRRSYPFIYHLRDSLVDNYDTLAVDFAMLLVALLLPISSSSLLEAPGRQYTNLWFRLPWAALLATGCSGCLAEAMRATDALTWMTQWAPHNEQYKFVTQILLTLGAALLTELVGRRATIALMMPIVADVVVGNLMLKVVCIVAIILTVSTLGNFIFQWNRLPEWFSPLPNATSMAAALSVVSQ
ncbi:uncharacterized protein LOC144116285 isoform X2 [Amblyomma americanum]